MLYRLLVTGLVSGAVAGVILTVFHFLMVEPLIFAAEQYEDQAAFHAAEVVVQHSHTSGVNHTHEEGDKPHEHNAEGAVHIHRDGSVHHHHGWSPADGIERSVFTLLANILVGIAYGILLATALTLYGREIGYAEGVLWGLAGFASFALLPGLGLPPELPAAAAADLFARQTWWLGTAAASVFGIALLVFGKNGLWKGLGLVLLVAPHVIGAPHPPAGAVGKSPPEMAAHFVSATMTGSMILWLVIGLMAAYMQQRLGRAEQANASD
jgi:cobalt transporter subunit CbtA